jgi:hypothetical protein
LVFWMAQASSQSESALQLQLVESRHQIGALTEQLEATKVISIAVRSSTPQPLTWSPVVCCR